MVLVFDGGVKEVPASEVGTARRFKLKTREEFDSGRSSLISGSSCNEKDQNKKTNRLIYFCTFSDVVCSSDVRSS